jgi:hypothetical protein
MSLVRDVVSAVSMVSAVESFFRLARHYRLCRELGKSQVQA